MPTTPTIDLTFSPRGRAGSGTLSVTIGGRTHVDDLKITRDSDRARILASLQKKFSELNWTPSVIGQMRGELDAIARGQAKAEMESPAPTEPTRDELLSRMPTHVRDQVRSVLEAPDLMDRIASDIEAVGVAGETRLAKTIYLVGVSRLLARPLAKIVQGPTSSGKSYEEVAKPFC
jgi:hypothetical protein